MKPSGSNGVRSLFPAAPAMSLCNLEQSAARASAKWERRPDEAPGGLAVAAEAGDPAMPASAQRRFAAPSARSAPRICRIGRCAMMSVVLIGGSRLLRGGLKLVLEESGTEIVGEYASTDEVKPREPRDSGASPVIDLLIYTPGRRRIRQEIGNLRRADADCRIAVMLSRLAADDLVEVFAAGGDGLVLEEISAQALHDSLALVALGEKVFPSQLAALLNTDRRAEVLSERPLTARQLEIVRRLASGQSNKEIANDLELAPATVKVHVKSLLKTLGLSNRTQAAIWAVNSGLVDRPEAMEKAAGDLQREPLPAREVEAPSDRFQTTAPEGRAAPVRSSPVVPSTPAPMTLAAGAGMPLGRGFGEASPWSYGSRRSKSD